MLIETIFSFSNFGVNVKYVKNAFWKTITRKNIKEKGNNLFEDSLARLNGAFVIQVLQNQNIYLKLVNNSLVDYITEKMSKSPAFKTELYENSCYSDQIINLSKWDLKEKLTDETIYNYITDELLDDYVFYPKLFLKLAKLRDHFKYTEDDYSQLASLLFDNNYLISHYFCCHYFNSFFEEILNHNSDSFIKYFVNPIAENVELLNPISGKVSFGFLNRIFDVWKIGCHFRNYEESILVIKKILDDQMSYFYIQLIADIASDSMTDAIHNCVMSGDKYYYASECDVKNELTNLIREDIDKDFSMLYTDNRLNPEASCEMLEQVFANLNIEERIAEYYNDLNCNDREYAGSSNDFEDDSDSKIIDSLFNISNFDCRKDNRLE